MPNKVHSVILAAGVCCLASEAATAATSSGWKLTYARDQEASVDIYLQGNKIKNTGYPDWVAIVLPGRRYALYSLGTKKCITRPFYPRQSDDRIGWKKVRTDASKKPVTTEFERTIMQVDPAGIRYAETQHVWTTDDIPMEEDMRDLVGYVAHCYPPQGIAVKYVRSMVRNGMKENLLCSHLLSRQSVPLKDSDFVVPKGLKEVKDEWEVVSGDDIDESLYQVKKQNIR